MTYVLTLLMVHAAHICFLRGDAAHECARKATRKDYRGISASAAPQQPPIAAGPVPPGTPRHTGQQQQHSSLDSCYGTFVLFSHLEHAGFRVPYLLMAIVNFNVGSIGIQAEPRPRSFVSDSTFDKYLR